MVLTKKDLDEAVELLTERFTGLFNDKVTAVAAQISCLEESIINNKSEMDSQRDEISELKRANAEQLSKIDDLTQKLETLVPDQMNLDNSIMSKKVHELEERVEDRTNRQLRQTLILRGVREQREESWNDTKDLVAKVISENTDVSFTTAEKMINRVHRGRPTPNRNQPRPIYMALHRWEDSEYTLESFRDLNICKRSTITVEYMYCPKTTLRRNSALLKRKQLKEVGVISSGYLQFPARLMVKKAGANRDDPYEPYEDFSSLEVDIIKSSNTRFVDTH